MLTLLSVHYRFGHMLTCTRLNDNLKHPTGPGPTVCGQRYSAEQLLRLSTHIRLSACYTDGDTDMLKDRRA
jgi:hypothetical protein